MACVMLSLLYIISLSQGFSTEIIHRDSPNSPLFQSNLSTLKAFRRDIKTSRIRASNLISLSRKFGMENSAINLHANSLQLPLLLRSPLFTLDIGVGTPATKTTLVFDTAAPLTWTQCQPCVKCFKQDCPVFDPSKSVSFKRVRRNHTLARWFNCTVLECYYFVESRGGQSSDGIVSMDTFSFSGAKQQRLEDVVFGCGTYNHGPLGPQTTLTGLLGMGNFPTSLVGQFGNRAMHRFSYCLPELRSSRPRNSILSVGQEAVISGKNVQTTPFLKHPQGRKLVQDSYRLNLTGISVAGTTLEIPKGSLDGGCILDTGAPFSIIEEQAYEVVINAFSSYFAQFRNVKKITDRKYPKNLCYKYPRGFRNFPSMVLHFEEANLEINGTSLFMFGRNFFMANFICLQLLGEPKTNILGVYQQQNIRLLYDLGNDKLSFARDSC
ncbi:aspartic proteinase CDR1-like [Sesamum indicum]|uniref:Aspartic proteinase CDR1-like n=1 Tax=Sesamum indicum TaxID=4182 RepID=A0A6I9TEV5_SESIN|nr:aspartic proteinase CDR1-like [Sesamum indicum]